MSRSIVWIAATLTAALLLTAGTSVARQPGEGGQADLTGKYALAGDGYLVVSVDDLGRVEGFFERNGSFGRLSGQAESNGVTAIWVQKNGSRACESTIDGSSHWGRVTLSRTEAGGLDLAWGTCREKPLNLETAR